MSSNTGRRYSTLVVARARKLAEAGWSAHDIQKILNKEDVPVSWATVKSWIDPDYRSVRRACSAEDQRRMRDVSGEHVKKRMLELQHAGLSYKAISVVVEIYHGRKITEHMVRYFLDAERQKFSAAA